MDMINTLQAVFAIVHEHAIPFLQPLALGNFGRCEHKVTQDVFIRLLCHAERGDPAFRDDEDVDRCLRIDVMEGEGEIVLVDNFCRDFFGDDFVENSGLGKIDRRVGSLLCGHVNNMRVGRENERRAMRAGGVERG